ncbi:triose-phosphate transporter family-domain-containing protein [Aspergillus unguis]
MYLQTQWSVVLCTLNWIFWSNLTILFNKWILESTPFHYPILLTTWHLIFATLATQLLARTSFISTSAVSMTPSLYISRIAPIGVLYSASLVCSNTSYMFLNVGFIQMLKASGPVITLLVSALYGVTTLTASKLANVGFIAACVGLTVASEIQFSWIGVALQMGGLVCDACRLVLMQVLSSPSPSSASTTTTASTSRSELEESDKEYENEYETGNGNENGNENGDGDEDEEVGKLHDVPITETEKKKPDTGLSSMNPLLSLYYTAPICAFMNAILAWRAEVYPLLNQTGNGSGNGEENGKQNDSHSLLEIILSTGLGPLVLNALVGFMLNVAVFTLIGKTSGLTMTLVSIPKNILLIIASALLWGTNMSALQGVGYAGALGGLVVYAGGDITKVPGSGITRRVMGSIGLGRTTGYESLGDEEIGMGKGKGKGKDLEE